MGTEHYYETKKYRCLFEHEPSVQSDALWLISCGVEYCIPDKSFGPTRRSGYHLHVVLSGEGTLQVEDRSIRLHTGQIFLEKPGEITHYYPDKQNPWIYCWVAFDGARAEYYTQQAGFDDGVNSLNCYVDTYEFYKLANSMLEKPQLNLAGSLRRFGLLNQFIGLAVESNLHSGGGSRRVAHCADNYIDHAIDYIRRNYSTISVADISSYIGVDRSYFANLFKRHIGMSPKDYLLRIRMRNSMQLLRNTVLPVQDVAEYVGYENPLTFSKVFKKVLGVSPKYYRSLPDAERPALPSWLIPIGEIE